MAKASIETKCSMCTEETSTFICRGCSQDFCSKHLAKHLETLKGRLYGIQDYYNQFRQTVIDQKNNPEQRILIKEVNQWEEDSIKKIKQTAKEWRERLINYTNKIINQIEITLDDPKQQPISIEGKTKDFNEIHLKQFNEKLNELKEKLDQTIYVSIKQESTSLINKIYFQFGKFFN
jgi:uncharacterized UBP type Zn finger protein